MGVRRAYGRGARPGDRGVRFAVPAAEAQALVATVSEASERLVGEVLPQTGTMIAQNPLQTEMKAVAEDARSAVDFLKLNFLPGARVAAK